MSQLLPEGIDHLADIPFTLHNAIKHALRILKYEEYALDERPPKHIWFDGEKLDAHWQAIEDERDARYGGAKSAASEPELDDSNSEGNAAVMELIKRG